MSSCQQSTGFADLKLRFWRFLCFAPHFNSSALCLGKTPKFANFSCLSEREQKWAHSCTNSCTRRSINGDAPFCGTGRNSRSDVELLLHIRFRQVKVGPQTEASGLDDDVLCGDAGHILLSKHVAEDLIPYRHFSRTAKELAF